MPAKTERAQSSTARRRSKRAAPRTDDDQSKSTLRKGLGFQPRRWKPQSGFNPWGATLPVHHPV